MINVHTLQLSCATSNVQSRFILPSMSLGLLSHCRGCLNKSSIAGIILCVVMFQSENGASPLIGLLDPSSATK